MPSLEGRVAVGAVETAIFSRSLGVEGAEAEEIMRLVAASTSAATPLGRMGLPADIAGTALWLASDDSAYVTGQAIVVDGGLTSVTALFAGVVTPG